MTRHLDQIEQFTIRTHRYLAGVTTTADQRPAPPGADALILVHGNVSCSWFFEPLMLALPFRCFAVDLRGFGDAETLPVDATRGLDDFADDVLSVVNQLGAGRVHLFGWSMGGGVVARMAIKEPPTVKSLTLQAPVSPHGLGGTHPDGTLVHPDAAGTGGAAVNPQFLERLRAGDAGEESAASPRQVYRSIYVAPGHTDPSPEGYGPLEDLWVAAMLSTATGEQNYPGDSTESANWPGFAPGTQGVLNAMAPNQFSWAELADIGKPPPVLWLRGDADAIVSDSSTSDVNHLGELGLLPGWPGAEVAPRQLMVTQTRNVLDALQARGGRYTELCLPGVGHSPHLERPDEVIEALTEHLQRA